MTQENLTKMFFMLFEIQEFKRIEKLYFDYRYMVRDNPDIHIIYGIANIANRKEDGFEILNNAKSTEYFANPRGYIPLICKELGVAIPPKYANIEELPSYNSPGYNMITINGAKYDAQMDAVRIANRLIGTPPFKEAVEAVTDEKYRNYLKIIHSLNGFDLDYGLETASIILSQGSQDIETLVLVINLLEAKQRISDDDISKLPVYAKLNEALQDTIYALNLVAIKKLKVSDIEYLKELKETKNHLYKTHPKELVDGHWKTIAKV